MPDKYRREMLADWRGAGRAQGTPDTRAWYIKHYHDIILHEDTRQWLDEQLGVNLPPKGPKPDFSPPAQPPSGLSEKRS